jgi:hypothetical protein
MKGSIAAVSAVATLLFAGGPAQAAIYDFSFVGIEDSFVHGSGTLTTTGGASPYSITGATGTIYDTDIAGSPFTITGLSPYAAADNLLYLPPTTGFWDNSYGGISFTTNTGGEFNLGGGGTDAPEYNILNSSLLNPSGYPQIGNGSYNVALSVASVPELSTWAMLSLGFAGLGLAAAARGRKKAVAAFN